MRFEFPRAKFVEAVFRELRSTSLVVLSGPRGAGKSSLLSRILRSRWGGGARALVQLEPISCSPEVLASELKRLAPQVLDGARQGVGPFDSVLEELRHRPQDSLLLLDDVTEIRTLSYYPSVEEPLSNFLRALATSGKAIATTRFSYWTRKTFPELIHWGIPALVPEELEAAGVPEPEQVAGASAGIAVHAARLAETLEEGAKSVESALSVELSPGGRIEAECRATLAELLQRARGYGACKAVLRVLAGEEGLKLTEVARRLDRTPGSTRDYLRWLEEVDLVVTRDKRFYYVDPLLRLWHRIYGRGGPFEEQAVGREVGAYLSENASVAVSPEPRKDFTLPPLPSEDLVEID